jgi:hypothetical protein
MNIKSISLRLAALLALATPVLEARHHHRHGPRMSFGMQVGYPVYAHPYYTYAPAPYYQPYYQPVVVAPARPSLGFSMGHGPFGFSVCV